MASRQMVASVEPRPFTGKSPVGSKHLILRVSRQKPYCYFDLTFSHSPVDTLTPGILALAVMSTSFTSLAIATGFERRYGVLKRLGSSPLPRSGPPAGKVGALHSWSRPSSSC